MEDEFSKLAECFEHVARFLYRHAQEQAPLLKSLHFLTRIFLECVPASLH